MTITSTSGTPILIFGVDHSRSEPAAAEYILRHPPTSVVVETAITPTHGSGLGNISTGLEHEPGPAGIYQQQFRYVASEVREAEDPSQHEKWLQVAEVTNGEQLAYIAAFAHDLDVVFGDRPKEITYQRLLHIPSLQDLDVAFARTTQANFQDLLGQDASATLEASYGDPFDRVLTLEREACLLATMHASAAEAAEQGQDGAVVAVVGGAHLPGLEYLQTTGKWQDMPDLLDIPPDSEGLTPEMRGAKRGLMEAVLGLSVGDEVLADMREVLGPLEPAAQGAYEMALEMYENPRTKLAAQSKEFLPEVCSGCGGVKLWEALSSIRSVMPSHGGPGYSPDVIHELRHMAYDFSAYGDPSARLKDW